MNTESATFKPGYCTPEDLPEPYCEHFARGTVKQLAGQFFPAATPNNVISMAVLLGLMYLLPTLFLLYSGLLAWYSRAPWLARISEDLSGSWGKQAVGLVILAVIVIGMAWMLRMSWLAWLRFNTWRTIKHSTPDSDHHGLLLDDQYLVFRHGEHFDEHCCGWVPKSSITGSRVKTIRHWFPKHSYDIQVVSLTYLSDDHNKELVIKERFGMSAVEMVNEIECWLKKGVQSDVAGQ